MLPFDPSLPTHLSALVNIWNAACGAELAINPRLVRYNTQPATGAIQAGRIAQHGDAPIGFALASALPNDPLTSPPEIGWVDAIAVLPEFQRQGVGSGLLNWAEDWLVAQGCAAARLGGSLRPFVPGYPVELGNVAFFKSRGYGERATAPFVWDVARVLSDDLYLASVEVRRTFAPSSPNLPSGQSASHLQAQGKGASDFAASHVSIRPSQPGDEDALLDFLRREFPGRWRFEFEEFLRARGRITDYQLLITNSKVTGFARLTFEDSERPIERYFMHRLPHPWAQLGPIGISADRRGRSLGGMLLAEALQQLKSRGVRGCAIDWTDQVEFYRKFGFVPLRQYAVLTKPLAIRTAPATGS